MNCYPRCDPNIFRPDRLFIGGPLNSVTSRNSTRSRRASHVLMDGSVSRMRGSANANSSVVGGNRPGAGNASRLSTTRLSFSINSNHDYSPIDSGVATSRRASNRILSATNQRPTGSFAPASTGPSRGGARMKRLSSARLVTP